MRLVKASEMQKMDQLTIQKLGIPGIVLMENAARGVTRIFLDHFNPSDHSHVLLICGPGNNGGDGYVIARQLFDDNIKVQTYSIGDPKNLKGDALINFIACKNLKIPLIQINSKKDIKKLKSPALIIDALLGTGIKGPVSGIYEDVIRFINRQKVPVAAVDIPSGLNGDIAVPPGEAINADFTISS